jgi:Ca2+-binding EF-hand superfamily protein
MTFKPLTWMAGATIVLLSTSAAWAQTPAPAGGTAAPAPAMSAKDMAEAFTKADVSKDGKLDKTEAEAIPALANRFVQADTDGDGMVSKAEFDTWAKANSK